MTFAINFFLLMTIGIAKKLDIQIKEIFKKQQILTIFEYKNFIFL